jgi:hypothetical protein
LPGKKFNHAIVQVSQPVPANPSGGEGNAIEGFGDHDPAVIGDEQVAQSELCLGDEASGVIGPVRGQDDEIEGEVDGPASKCAKFTTFL